MDEVIWHKCYLELFSPIEQIDCNMTYEVIYRT